MAKLLKNMLARSKFSKYYSLQYSKTRIPGSSFEPGGGPLEDKAVLVTLSICDDNILQLFHDWSCTPAHQPQGPVVIGLCKLVLLRKPENQLEASSFLIYWFAKLLMSSLKCTGENSLVKVASIQSDNNIAVP